jgi:hypothetical protein
MVNALAAHFPFAGAEEMVYYYPSPVERYFPVAPGIEVSMEPYTDSRDEDRGSGNALYDGRGKLASAFRKGSIVDTCL